MWSMTISLKIKWRFQEKRVFLIAWHSHKNGGDQGSVYAEMYRELRFFRAIIRWRLVWDICALLFFAALIRDRNLTLCPSSLYKPCFTDRGLKIGMATPSVIFPLLRPLSRFAAEGRFWQSSAMLLSGWPLTRAGRQGEMTYQRIFVAILCIIPIQIKKQE